jgi:myosin heavy subunit
LLEKSRIPKPGRGERNFHIFVRVFFFFSFFFFASITVHANQFFIFLAPTPQYQLLRGCPPAAAEALRLPLRADPERFGYLATGASILEGVDDAADFAETLSAMKSVGLGGRGQEAIIKLLAAILHLGNAQFTEHASRQGAKIEGEGARLAAELLELSWETLEKSVTTRKIETRGETVSSSAGF